MKEPNHLLTVTSLLVERFFGLLSPLLDQGPPLSQLDEACVPLLANALGGIHNGSFRPNGLEIKDSNGLRKFWLRVTSDRKDLLCV